MSAAQIAEYLPIYESLAYNYAAAEDTSYLACRELKAARETIINIDTSISIGKDVTLYLEGSVRKAYISGK